MKSNTMNNTIKYDLVRSITEGKSYCCALIDVIKNNPSDKWNIIIITLHEIVCEEFTQDKILEFLEIEKELSTQD